jgi:cytochrome c oxidase subunit 2
MGGLGGTLPIDATEYAKQWDNLYYFLMIVCVVFFAIVIIPMVYFAIRYRDKPGAKAATHITHNLKLEFLWTIIPTVIVMVIFVWGWVVYRQLYQIPQNAMEIRVVAKSWNWTFQYDDGRTTTNAMYVPTGQPVKLTITADRNDVLHSFYVPHFRIKKDAVPGMFTYLWFNVPTEGQYVIFCTEYCGAGHSDMLAKVIAVKPEEFEKWKWGAEIPLPKPVGLVGPEWGPSASKAELETKTETAAVSPKKNPHSGLAEQGRALSGSLGCVSCHSDDGSTKIGPSYKGLFGSSVELADGRKVVVDENYIRQQIEDPQSGVIKGFEGQLMPTYKGQVTAEQMNALIAYMKSLN